jgi:biotin carboxyl carrier protein
MAQKKNNKINNDADDIIEKLSELVIFAKENKLSEFELETENFGLKIKKHNSNQNIPIDLSFLSNLGIQSSRTDIVNETKPEKPLYNPEKILTAPLNGIFYRAKSPTSQPLAKEGDYISPGTVVCLVSSCKNLNEIVSDKSGRIAKFLVANEANVAKGDAIVLLE